MKRNPIFTKLHSVHVRSVAIIFVFYCFIPEYSTQLRSKCFPDQSSRIPFGGAERTVKSKRAWKESEGGLEQGFPRSLKMTHAQDIIVSEVRNQRLRLQFLYFR